MCHPCHTTNKHDNNILMMIITRYLQTWMVPEVKNKQKTKKKKLRQLFGFWSILVLVDPVSPLTTTLFNYHRLFLSIIQCDRQLNYELTNDDYGHMMEMTPMKKTFSGCFFVFVVSSLKDISVCLSDCHTTD